MRVAARGFVLCLGVVLAAPAAGALECPDGAKLQQKLTSWSRELWCELADAHGARRHGPYRLETLEGKVVISGSYSQGGRAGAWQTFSNGDLQGEIHYARGRKDGLLRRYHPDGGPELEEHYREGELHGPFRSWYANGQLRQEGEYAHGEETGTWIRWSREGEVLREGRAEAGERVGVWRRYGPGGEVISERRYERDRAASSEAGPSADPIREDKIIGVKMIVPPRRPPEGGGSGPSSEDAGPAP